jgi:hypothetical protein
MKEKKAQEMVAGIALVSYDAKCNGFSEEAVPKDLGAHARAAAAAAEEVACAHTDNGEGESCRGRPNPRGIC